MVKARFVAELRILILRVVTSGLVLLGVRPQSLASFVLTHAGCRGGSGRPAEPTQPRSLGVLGGPISNSRPPVR